MLLFLGVFKFLLLSNFVKSVEKALFRKLKSSGFAVSSDPKMSCFSKGFSGNCFSEKMARFDSFMTAGFCRFAGLDFLDPNLANDCSGLLIDLLEFR